MNITIFIFLAAILISPAILSQAFAEPSIELKLYGDSISPNENVLIVGKITDATLWKPVTLQVSDPSGNLVYSPKIDFDGDGNFRYMITPTLPSFLQGTYTIEASHPDSSKPTTIQFTVNDGTMDNMDPRVIPEFGGITLVILMVTISAIIIMTKKSLIGFHKL